MWLVPRGLSLLVFLENIRRVPQIRRILTEYVGELRQV